MRNHRKLKAIRTKFGITGYAIWSMILEYLTGIDGNEFEYSDTEIELIAGDFGVSDTEIRNIIDYCIKLELLFQKNGFIHSESLDERLLSVYEKRNRSKNKSSKQLRVNGKFSNINTEGNGVSATEKPQSKVKESKVKESKVNNFNSMPLFSEFSTLPEIYIQKSIEAVKFTAHSDILQETVSGMWEVFKVQNLTGSNHYENVGKIYSHFINWIKKQKFENGNSKSTNQQGIDYKSHGANLYADRIKSGIAEIKGT